MLIKRSIVERWYLTTSPIYKNFAYLFQNPLWNKGVPSGFSVCPYFWLSLFSLFVFRPFAMIASRMIIPTARVVAPPARLGFFVIGVAGSISFLGYEIYRFYRNEVSPYHEAILAFWSVLSFTVLAFASLIHDDYPHQTGKCRWASYVWLWAALTVGACFYWFRPGLLLEWKFTIGVIAEAAGLFWFGVQAAVHWIWIALIWSGHALWKLVSWQPYIRYVPWYVYPAAAMGLMGLLVWITDRLTRNPKPKAGKADYYNQWETYLVWLLRRFPIECCIEIEWKWLGEDPDFIPSGFHTAVIKRWVNPIVCDLRLISPPAGLWAGKKRYRDMEDFRWKVNDSFKLVGRSDLASIIEHKQLDAAVAAELKEGWVKDAIILAKRDKAEDARLEERWLEYWENSRLRKACLSFTTGLRTTGEFVVATPFRATWHIIKALGMGLATFFAYLWMLLVAKKKGACPYFTFRDK